MKKTEFSKTARFLFAVFAVIFAMYTLCTCYLYLERVRNVCAKCVALPDGSYEMQQTGFRIYALPAAVAAVVVVTAMVLILVRTVRPGRTVQICSTALAVCSVISVFAVAPDLEIFMMLRYNLGIVYEPDVTAPIDWFKCVTAAVVLLTEALQIAVACKSDVFRKPLPPPDAEEHTVTI